MVNLLSRVISACRLLKYKSYKVVGTAIQPDSLASPIQLNARVYTNPGAQGFKTFAHSFHNDPVEYWYFPLVGTLYTHVSGYAVYLEKGSVLTAARHLESYLTVRDNFPTVVLENEVRSHPVLSNGFICSPEEAAYIQNKIRATVDEHFNSHPFDMSIRDISIHNTIDHELMSWYVGKFDLKLN